MRDTQFSSDDPFIQAIPLRRSTDIDMMPDDPEPTQQWRGWTGRLSSALVKLRELLVAFLPI
jgi:hypothetical protein